jgi:Kef-type K+ transport system membrane component KefB
VTSSIVSLAAAATSPRLLALILTLALVLVVAKIMGNISVRLHQPAVLGELLAGLILGPSVLDLFNLPLFREPGLSTEIHELAQIGVILLMFTAGMEIELTELQASGRPAIFGGFLGVITPLGLGLLGALAFGFPVYDAVFIGIVLSATSVSISAQTLLELGRLRSKEGIALLGAAVIDDILVIMALSVFVVLVEGGGTLAGIFLQLAQMLLVLGVSSLAAWFLFPRIATWARQLKASEGLLAVTLALALFLAWATEYLGSVAAITGAFLAGVGLARSHLRSEIEDGLHRVAYAFFVPLFLVDIGLQANIRQLDPTLLFFTSVLILIAIVSKILGSGIGARLGGFQMRAALRLGLGMISRGEVGLIVAGVGITLGILPNDQFAAIVLLVLVTTLITPILLRWAYQGEEAGDA